MSGAREALCSPNRSPDGEAAVRTDGKCGPSEIRSRIILKKIKAYVHTDVRCLSGAVLLACLGVVIERHELCWWTLGGDDRAGIDRPFAPGELYPGKRGRCFGQLPKGKTGLEMLQSAQFKKVLKCRLTLSLIIYILDELQCRRLAHEPSNG